MIERDFAQGSVAMYSETWAAARNPHENLQEPSRPLDRLPVEDRAFFRVLYGLDLTWADLEYLAAATDRSTTSLVEQIQDIYTKNMQRRVDAEKLTEKIASAYSRLTELSREEHLLEETLYALSVTQPVDPQRRDKVALDLERNRQRMAQLRGQQEKWRSESGVVLRLPSKEVSRVFNISPAAVDQRAVRIGRRVRALSRQSGVTTE